MKKKFLWEIISHLFSFPVSAAALLACEWIARGGFDLAVWDTVWNENIYPHRKSYFLAWLLLWLVYFLLDCLTRCAPLAVIVTGLVGCVPGVVCYFTLSLRGEPFLPWQLFQLAEAGKVIGAAGLKAQPSMLVAFCVFLLLAGIGFVLARNRFVFKGWPRAIVAVAPLAALIYLVWGVYLNPAKTLALGIRPDPWMQDRYYRWYGVISGFMTNLQNLDLDRPENYNRETVEALLQRYSGQNTEPLFAGSYAAQPESVPPKQPTILYVMDESYWDVSRLCALGVEFNTDVAQNLHQLQQSSVFGRIYSPSFGGGTCDVEFEALTGFSVSHLPAGSKPFQQHVTREMFSLPRYLRDNGYQTAAVHCYYAKYWSRNTAYPRLGLEEFISLERMHDVEKLRKTEWKSGLVSDASMGEQIIRQYEAMKTRSSAPVFLHAVTMQNHTNYNAANYPEEQRVRVTQAPEGMSAGTIGALEDFATGIRDADALLGMLTDYFSQQEEPVVLVFWGDHYNPIGAGYEVYTSTGYAPADSAAPALRCTDLLIWANYADRPLDIGTIAAYQLSPTVLDLFGLERPAYYRFMNDLLQNGYRSRTAGNTVKADGTISQEMTDDELDWYQNQWLLQYDLMFGEEYGLAKSAGNGDH